MNSHFFRETFPYLWTETLACSHENFRLIDFCIFQLWKRGQRELTTACPTKGPVREVCKLPLITAMDWPSCPHWRVDLIYFPNSFLALLDIFWNWNTLPLFSSSSSLQDMSNTCLYTHSFYLINFLNTHCIKLQIFLVLQFLSLARAAQLIGTAHWPKILFFVSNGGKVHLALHNVTHQIKNCAHQSTTLLNNLHSNIL